MLWIIDWLACGLVRIIGGLLCRLPASTAVWIGEQLGGLAYWLRPKRTRIGLANVRAAFDPSMRAPANPSTSLGAESPAIVEGLGVVPSDPPQSVEGESRDDGQLTLAQSRRILHSYYRQLGAGLVELLRLPVIDRAYVERYISLEGGRYLEDAVAAGKPVVFLTGHYGNWEFCSIVAAFRGYPIVALARAQEKLPRLYRLLVSYRESKGCAIVHKGDAMQRLMAALDQGRCIGIVGDQASRQGIFVEFFGRPASFATGPFQLAYRKEAVILPVFIHRLHGPFHRVVIEPPVALPRTLPRADAIRQGVEQFAGALSRHIRADPGQWLWMHKRWKHTSARRVLVLSDGKLGHLKQSLAVVDALREECPALVSQVIEVRYRDPVGRLLTLLWSWWAPAGLGGALCLSCTLTGKTQAALLGRYADLIVSCGSSLAPVNLLWAAENRAKSVVILNPAPLPLRRFSLVIAPRHDRLPARSNVVQTAGAITRSMRDEELRAAKERLLAHPNVRSDGSGAPRGPVISVFIGGDTPQYELPPSFTAALIREVKTACEALDGSHLVTTSRRTSAPVERLLSERLGGEPRCRLLLIAHHDSIDGTMEGMLGSADLAVVTGESISMVSEACASGRPVIVVEPPRRRISRTTPTKHQRFLRDLVQEGYLRLVPLPEVGLAIQRALKEGHGAKRLETYTVIRDALAKLL